jgi:hypothetical protein
MGCLRVGAICQVTWTLWQKILPLQLKLTIRPLHLELVACGGMGGWIMLGLR